MVEAKWGAGQFWYCLLLMPLGGASSKPGQGEKLYYILSI